MSAHLPPYAVVLSDHCNRVRCEPGWHLGPDWAPRLRDYDLWYVSAGRGRMTTSDGEVPLAPGVCLWMRPGRRYEAEHDRAAPLVVNFFHFELRGVPRDFTPPVEVMRTAHPDFADAMMHRILALQSKADPDARRSAENLFGALLGEFVRETAARATDPAEAVIDRHHREIIQRLAAEIRESPAKARTVVEMARVAGYSVDHFSRIFAKITGQRPQDWVIEARLVRARQLLVETDLTISQIADALNFRDVFFFSRQFRQKTGRSPTEFRAAFVSASPG
jgi:AraC-like DNA-binding protein